MKNPFDMKRLRHGCGESLKIKRGMLLHLAWRIEQLAPSDCVSLLGEGELWQICHGRETNERICG